MGRPGSGPSADLEWRRGSARGVVARRSRGTERRHPPLRSIGAGEGAPREEARGRSRSGGLVLSRGSSHRRLASGSRGALAPCHTTVADCNTVSTRRRVTQCGRSLRRRRATCRATGRNGSAEHAGTFPVRTMTARLRGGVLIPRVGRARIGGKHASRALSRSLCVDRHRRRIVRRL